MTKRSEGIRRILLILSVLLVISWTALIGIASDGFSNINLPGWIVFTGGLVIVYFIPSLIARIVYWVIDGFKKDRKT